MYPHLIYSYCLVIFISFTFFACGSTQKLTFVEKKIFVQEISQGDISCYVYVDEQLSMGYPARFDLCSDSQKYIGKEVIATFEKSNVSACEGNQECGKTHEVLLIKKLVIISEKK